MELIQKPKSQREAQYNADTLAAYMRLHAGGEWKTRVWHNLWWCWEVSLGSIALHHSDATDTFHAMIGDEPGKTGGTPSHWFRDEDRSSDPVQAVRNAMKTLKNVIKQYFVVYSYNNELMKK